MGALLARSGANTATLVQNALDTWVPDYHFVLIILNETGFGGCGGGGFQIVTLGGGWAVMAHEFGHGTGGLADEYCRPGTYTGGEPGAVNVTANTRRATLKWKQFVNPATPVPTGINASPGTERAPGTTRGHRPPAGATIRTLACSRRSDTRQRDLPSRGQLPHARQFASVLPRLLYRIEDTDAPVQRAQLLQVLRR